MDAADDEPDMDTFAVLGQHHSRTTDGSRTTWNLFGNTPIPFVSRGQFFYSADDKLIYDQCAAKAKPPAASRIIELVGEDEEIAEIPVTGAFVPLPAGTSSVTVSMDSSMRRKHLLVRRRRQPSSGLDDADVSASATDDDDEKPRVASNMWKYMFIILLLGVAASVLFIGYI